MARAGDRAARVLIVDDDPHLVSAIKGVLEDEGYEVDTALNGAAALRRVTAATPDVILLDVNMPVMSGLDVLEWLKRTGVRIPVVIATQEDDVQADDVGAVAKLTKPFLAEQLL